MKRILLTTDLSEASKTASEYAIYIANATGAEIHLLYCYQEKYEPFIEKRIKAYEKNQFSYGEVTDHKEAAGFLLKRYSADLRMKLKSDLVEHTVDGQFQNVVFEFIKKQNIDLVVIASQGINSFEDQIFGSNALKILRKSVCPVLVVPHRYYKAEISNILLSTDLSSKEALMDRYLSQFAKKFEAKLTLLHIDDGKHSIDEKDLVNFKRKARNLKYGNVVAEIEPNLTVSEGITEYIEKNDIDLLTIMSHTNSLLGKLFHKSTVKSTLSKIKVPVLGFNDSCLKKLEEEINS